MENKLYKNSLYKEYTSENKLWYEEKPSFEQPVKLSALWIDPIPFEPPLTNTETVKIINIQLTEDQTVEGHKAFYICSNPGLLTTRLYNFIQPSKEFSIKYTAKLFKGESEIFIGDYDFDYLNGIITFKQNNTLLPLIIKTYQYIGRKGSLDTLGKTNIDTSGSLNAAYENGAEIFVDSGPVILNASNGSAALQIDSVSYVPTSDLRDGQIIYNNNMIYIYNENKAKWLSLYKQSILFTAKNADGILMRVGDSYTFIAPRSGIISGITATAISGNAQKHIDVKINNSISFGFNLNNLTYSNNNININFNTNDLIQMKVSSINDITYNLTVNMEIAWRI
jgi:hypothetical protein